MRAFFYGLNSVVESSSKQNRQNQTGVTVKWSQVLTVRLKGATSPFLVALSKAKGHIYISGNLNKLVQLCLNFFY